MKKLMVCAMALCLAVGVGAQTRQRIEKASDLPRFSYPVAGKLEKWVRDDAAFGAFAASFRRDTQGMLDQFDIADKSMQSQLLGSLLQLDLLEGQFEQAARRVEALRAVQEKPADQLMAGLLPRAIIAARQATGNTDSPQYRQQLAQQLRKMLDAMPFDVVANDVRSAKASAETMGENLVLGRLANTLQPVVDQSAALSSELAPGLVSARYALRLRLPLKPTLIDTYSAYLAAHKVDKADIWRERLAKLPGASQLSPVTIAVWDSGVDSRLFGKQVLRERNGKPVLIAFDKYSNPSRTELVTPPKAMAAGLTTQAARSKGFSDLQSNIDSAEASEVKQFLSALKPELYKTEIEALNFYGNYSHGTHVAGIAMEGNPAARLLVARLEFGHTFMPDPCPSREQSEKDAKASVQTVQFLAAKGARVVNMSWGGSVGDIEADLERCAPKLSQKERQERAREYLAISRDALTKAFAAAPQVLFITAAGNSNQDASFAEDSPADIVLPNLLTVGAVDKAGDEANFTSYGPTVRVHANGYQVESYLPGGKRVAYSGTSMAAPQVANLAGKMLAVNPKLTPTQVIDIIIGTADKSADGRRTLMHPGKALERAGKV